MNKRILNLAIPNIISNITIPLLGMVDIALMGHLDSVVYIGAIGLGSTIFNVLYWLFAFLRISTAGMTAQSYGKKNFTEAALVFSRAMLVALLVGIVIILFRNPIAELSFIIIKGSTEVEEYARQYFLIRIFAAPVTIGLFVISGWFIGMQNTRSPMIIGIFVNVINIIANFILVKKFQLKSDGVAYGTLMAQYSGFILGVIILIKYYKKVLIRWTYKKMVKLKEIYNFFTINVDIFIRMMAIVFVFTYFNIESATYGDNILALNNILLQFFFLFSFLADGFAHAAEALVGKYVGSNSLNYAKKAIRYLFYWGIAISICFSITYLIFCNPITGILTNDIYILQLAKEYYIYIWLLPIISVGAFIWDGIYIGATASKAMRNTMILSSAIIFLPVYLLLEKLYGNHSLWIALLLFLLARGLFMTMIFKKAIYRRFGK